MGVQKISRQEEAEIPQFHSQKEASAWFKDRYGADFILTEISHLGDRECYFYRLILDHAVYSAGIKEMAEPGYIKGTEYLHSYQAIEIMENGEVHIVH